GGSAHELPALHIRRECWIAACFPSECSSTAEACRHCRPNAEPDVDLGNTLTEEPVDEWRYTLVNDLEQAVFPRIRVSGNLKDQMYEFGAVYASMSGSGSAVYGIFEQDFVATNAYKGFLELELPASLTRPSFEPDYGIYRKV